MSNITIPASASFPAFQVKPHAGKNDFMNKHVKWLKEGSGLEKIGKIVLAILEIIVLSISLVGIAFIVKGFEISHGLDAMKKFNANKLAGNFNGLEPSATEVIELKTKTRSFNHVDEFAIENNMLWFRKKGSQAAWQPIYFDGKVPVELHVDGANLVVIDQDNKVHYKKVLREFRKNDVYSCIEKAENNNWKDKWFSIPFLHVIANLITGKRLQLPEETKAWAISQRGKYNYYLEDGVQPAPQKHHVETGVTTLYTLNKDGTEIKLWDPWVPKGATATIYMPETKDSSYVAGNMQASGSCVMTVGYKLTAGATGGVKGTLEVNTYLADIDSLGWNPFLDYDYEKQTNPDIRILPMGAWENHPLNLQEGDEVTKNITVFQTGEGNRERELRIEGSHEGQTGYFRKKLDDQDWQFIASGSGLMDQPLDETIDAPDATLVTSVHKYRGTMNVDGKVATVTLSHFGQSSFHAKLKIDFGTRKVTLPIYSRQGILNFIGKKTPNYELVLSPLDRQDGDLKKIFKKVQKIMPLDIEQTAGGVKLSDSLPLLARIA